MEIKIACETKLYLPLENLKPFQGSLKDHGNKEKLKKQILDQGFAAPIFVWKNDGKYYILDGHGRCSALQDLKSTGYKIPDLPCVEIHAKTKREAKKKLLSYVSQFGKVTGAGLYEFINEAELTLEELDDFEIPEINLEDFKEEFFPEDKPEGSGSEDNVPEVAQNELGVKLGDIFELGNHRLMCGDSTDLATVEKLMNGEKADMVFTDPPYGMNLDTDYTSMKGWHTGKKYKPVAGDNEDFKPELIQLMLDIFSYCKEIVLWGADYYCELLPDKNKGSWAVWDKRVDESKDSMYGSCFELCWSKNKHKRLIFRKMWAGFMGDAEASKRMHPTQKPTELITSIFSEWANGLVTIVDLFGGSGSTLIACEKTNRKCLMMELDPHYCSVIIKRWEEYTGKKHKKLT